MADRNIPRGLCRVPGTPRNETRSGIGVAEEAAGPTTSSSSIAIAASRANNETNSDPSKQCINVDVPKQVVPDSRASRNRSRPAPDTSTPLRQSGRRATAPGPCTPLGPTNAQAISTVMRRTSAPSLAAAAPGPSPAPAGNLARTLFQKEVTRSDVTVCVRLRPGPEDETCVSVMGNNAVRLRQPPMCRPDVCEATYVYQYDHSFGGDATQEQIYEQAVSRICDSVLQGYNGSVIAYGQTGSGKTHTMIGNGRMKGIAPRAVQAIFATLEQRQAWAVEVSLLEIYNEKVRDLLAPGPGCQYVEIHEVTSDSGNQTFRCPEATLRSVTNPQDALNALTEGTRRRETARTEMNHNSSRSHVIFTIVTTQKDKDLDATLRGRLNFVDLAGSERLKRSQSSESPRPQVNRQGSGSMKGGNAPGTGPSRTPRDQRKEAGDINKSLSQLALVIQRLTGGSAGMQQCVPYRDSMLTRLLAENFGGNSKTCLIITCSPLISDREETRCSLEFGKRAKLVKNKAELNLEIAHAPTPVLRALVAKEVVSLQREREEMLQERELMIADRVSLQKRLSEVERLLSEAAANVLQLQEQRTSDAQRLELDNKQMERWLLNIASSSKVAEESSSSEAARLAAEIARIKQDRAAERRRNEEERGQLREQVAEGQRRLEARGQDVMGLRREVQQLVQDKAAAVAKLEDEIVALRGRWLEEFSSLEREKAGVIAQFEEERARLQRQLREERSERLRLQDRLGATTKESAPATATEDLVVALAAKTAEAVDDLRRSIDAATTDVRKFEEQRQTWAAGLENEGTELQAKWQKYVPEESPTTVSATGTAASEGNVEAEGPRTPGQDQSAGDPISTEQTPVTTPQLESRLDKPAEPTPAVEIATAPAAAIPAAAVPAAAVPAPAVPAVAVPAMAIPLPAMATSVPEVPSSSQLPVQTIPPALRDEVSPSPTALPATKLLSWDAPNSSMVKEEDAEDPEDPGKVDELRLSHASTTFGQVDDLRLSHASTSVSQ